MRAHHFLQILVFGFFALAVQPVTAAETLAPTDTAGPTINISKISFKNIHPDVNGYQLLCHVSSHDYKSMNDSEIMAMVGYTLARATMEDKTYFSSDPSRRKSSEISGLKLPTTIGGIGGNIVTKQDLLKAKSWVCLTHYYTKSAIGVFDTAGKYLPGQVTSDSTPVIYGKF